MLNPEEKTDEELVSLTLKNQDYFLYLMKRYEKKLFNYILKISNFSPEEAEDILQEVFLKAYSNLNDFDSNLKLSSWLYRISHNQTISHYRKKKARPQSISLDEDNSILNNLAVDLDIKKEIELNDFKKDIAKILNSLDFKYKEVLILKYFEDKSYQEISDILKKPPGTIATLINRAKKQFKSKLWKIKI